MEIKTVFLSSTFVDLEAYRQAAIDTCQRLDLHPIGMEYFNSKGVGATEGCKKELDKADVYVGLYAHRYGYIEDTTDGRSVTEIEFDYAGQRGIERLCFVLHPKHPWPSEYIDYTNHDKQEKFKNDKVGKLVRREFTTVDNFAMLLNSALVEWKDRQDKPLKQETYISSGSSSAIFAKRVDHLREKPRVFIGRENLFNQVYPLLETHQQVLLQGFGGMGKTALAAALAAKWINDGKGSVLWLKTGSAEADALFEALARPFNQQQAIASQTGEAKITTVNDLLHDCGASLLVLDDCWNSRALFTLLEAVPSAMPVLMTARQRYPIEGEIIPIEKLSDEDALRLLTQHAGSVGTQRAASAADGDNLELCHLLGNHAFAVEIAGKTLKAHTWTPAELIAQIKDAPDKLTMPLELAETGRENVAKLLEVSLNALDEPTSNVFLAFGAFFAPQLTAEMLQLYFEGDSTLSSLAGSVGEGLNALHLNGLVERLPATETSITAFRIHDLAYSYARAQATDDEHGRALQACLSYTGHYKNPSFPNFAALRPELDNLLGAADWAFEYNQNAAVERFAWDLYIGSAMGGFLYYQGFSSQATYLLLQAAQAAERAGNKRDQSAHLGNLGTAYADLGQVEQAIEYHQQSLTISREISDKSGEGVQLGNLGTAYADLGQMEQAIEYHQQALIISREISDKRNEGNQLGSLGTAYADLGQVEQAIDYHQQALTISREIGDKRNEGRILGNLGLAYADLGQMDKAIDYHQQALAIAHEIGDRMNQADQLNNIGKMYSGRKDYVLALQHYQQARAIYAEIGAQDRLARTEQNIAIVQAKMNAAPNSPF